MASWVWRPFRSKPEPVPEVAPAEFEPPVVDEVSRSVQDAANVLAQRIWSTGAQPRSHLLRGINPPDADRYLDYAIAQGWVKVDGDQVGRGAVNPVRLPEPVSALEQRLRWGPGWD